MKRGRKSKQEVTELRNNIVQRPSFLDTLPQRGTKGKAVAILSAKIKQCANSETVVYTIQEFNERFDVKKDMKYEITYIKTQLRTNYGHTKVKSYFDNEMGRVYFWENDVKKGGTK